MGKCISFGVCDKNYICLYIANLLVYLVSILSYILADIYRIKDQHEGEKYNNHLLTLFLSYIGQSLSFVLQIILNKCIIQK